MAASRIRNRGASDTRCGNRTDPAASVASLDAETIRFIEGQPFFILGTANETGDCDCSYRGREPRSDGTLQPLLQSVDAVSLVLPNFSGNKLLNSIGNLLRNPHLALLFVDFAHGVGTAIRGAACIEHANASAWQHVWPTADAFIIVGVRQVVTERYGDIPALRPVPCGHPSMVRP